MFVACGGAAMPVNFKEVNDNKEQVETVAEPEPTKNINQG